MNIQSIRANSRSLVSVLLKIHLTLIFVITGGILLSQTVEYNRFPSVFIVQSDSMSPRLKTGHLIVTYPMKRYSIGDVITFYDTDRDITITHRIGNVKRQLGFNAYQTQGDANEEEDTKPVELANIKGKVFITIPYVGYVTSIIANPVGILFLVILPGLYVTINELLSISKLIKKQQEKQLLI